MRRVQQQIDFEVKQEKRALLVADWVEWRKKVIAHLQKMIKAHKTHLLINTDQTDPYKMSNHQKSLVQTKAEVVKQFMQAMNRREEEGQGPGASRDEQV